MYGGDIKKYPPAGSPGGEKEALIRGRPHSGFWGRIARNDSTIGRITIHPHGEAFR